MRLIPSFSGFFSPRGEIRDEPPEDRGRVELQNLLLGAPEFHFDQNQDVNPQILAWVQNALSDQENANNQYVYSYFSITSVPHRIVKNLNVGSQIGLTFFCDCIRGDFAGTKYQVIFFIKRNSRINWVVIVNEILVEKLNKNKNAK